VMNKPMPTPDRTLEVQRMAFMTASAVGEPPAAGSRDPRPKDDGHAYLPRHLQADDDAEGDDGVEAHA